MNPIHQKRSHGSSLANWSTNGCFSIILLALTPLFTPFAIGQTSSGLRTCPGQGGALNLDAVLELISGKNPRVADLISVCHVSFALDPAAVERLSGAGAPGPVLDALDRETLSRLSLSQARAEVVALESRKGTNETAVNLERDAALGKSDADYKVQREKVAHIEAKREFETTAEYNGRVEKAQADLTAADHNHEAERGRLTEKYAADLGRKNQPLDRRIAVLKRALFPVAGAPPTYTSYNADGARLTVGIGGQEFWFSVEPRRAQALKEHWSAVKVMQRYEDEDSRDRFLADASTADAILGRPRSVVEEQQRDQQIQTLLVSAQQHLGARMYDQARDEYARVLTPELDPNNQTAKDGIAATARAIEEAKAQQAAIQQQTQRLAELRRNLAQNPKLIPGAWYDSATDLLWTDQDNGTDVTWQAASTFCQALRIGGFSDWRLGTSSELRNLYDPSKTKYSKACPKCMASNKDAPSYPYHIKGNITLSEPGSWSSTTANAGSAFAVFFTNGTQEAHRTGVSGGARALCTRHVEISAETANVAPPTTVGQSAKGNNTVAVRVGQFVCPGAVLLDVDLAMKARVVGGFSGQPVSSPGDRVITVPIRIVEVDPQGIGLFRVEGSQTAYALKSGPPPKSSCP